MRDGLREGLREGMRLYPLTAETALRLRTELMALLIDAVEGGASVNFVRPMTAAKAESWWDGALAAQARGERVILVAEMDGRVDGTVQLILPPMENQPHRADVGKMLVHRRARRQGLGAALLAAVEAEARRLGRSLLTLDTETDSAGERLYTRQGWVKFGEVPGYALTADGSGTAAASFFYKRV